MKRKEEKNQMHKNDLCVWVFACALHECEDAVAMPVHITQRQNGNGIIWKSNEVRKGMPNQGVWDVYDGWFSVFYQQQQHSKLSRQPISSFHIFTISVLLLLLLVFTDATSTLPPSLPLIVWCVSVCLSRTRNSFLRWKMRCASYGRRRRLQFNQRFVCVPLLLFFPISHFIMFYY